MYDIKNIIDKLILHSNSKNNKELAEKIGISYNTLNTWLKRGVISIDPIFNYVKENNLSLDFLFNIDNNTVEYTIKGRILQKVKEDEKGFQSELLLLHSFLEETNLQTKGRIDLINSLQKYEIKIIDKLFISQKNKTNLISFFFEISDLELQYIFDNKNDFLVIIYDFRNFTNKFFTLDTKPI